MDQDLYVGLISGTSVDGVDAALVSFSDSRENFRPVLLASLLHPYPASLRSDILSLFLPGNDEVDRLGAIDCAIGELFADAALHLLAKAGVQPDQVCAIGSHGQTIRHRPQGRHPFTLQIGNPYVLAEATSMDVVWDFRRRDMAVGGQGAPLAPLFHQAFMASDRETRVVLNLGGIANITRLPMNASPPVAFDTGPANGLMDAWIQRVKGLPFDKDGDWAGSVAADDGLLAVLLDEPYFRLGPPKSTGKELFHLPWVEARRDLASLDPAVVQATFLALTVESVARAIESSGGCERVLACGGGVHNLALLRNLATRLGVAVDSTASVGVPPDWLEAMAFAWLARCFVRNEALVTQPFTGARKPAILGSFVPGKLRS